MKPLPYSVFDAIQHLSAADETMAALIHSIGPYEGGLRPADSPFEALCEAVAYQQLSGKAAATIYGRFRSLTDESRPLDPLLVSKLSEEQLRGCGLSRAKSAAKKKFDVYPSAYANAWASKWYKSKGGGWSGGNNKVASRGKSKSKKT